MLDLVIVITLILLIIIATFVDKEDLTVVEGRDGKKYEVRNLPDKDRAVDTLIDLRTSLASLLDYVEQSIDESKDPQVLRFKEYIPVMKQKLPNVKIRENTASSKHTSYSVNKGQELVFCIRSKRDNNIHPLNELLYVAIHELAHIGCPEIGHTKLFYELNLFLLKKAVEFNLYRYNNYNNQPREYCGITLNNTILNSA